MQDTDGRQEGEATLIIDRQLQELSLKGFGRHTFWVGILLLILGAVGIALPPLLAITTVGLISAVLLVGGGFWLWHTWQHGGSFMSWLKPLLLCVAAVLMISRPAAGADALALLLGFYLLLDTFGSFALAHALRPDRGWVWMLINGIIDLILAAIVLFTWPASSVMLIGIFVGVSLLFDGAALTAIGWALRKG